MAEEEALTEAEAKTARQEYWSSLQPGSTGRLHPRFASPRQVAVLGNDDKGNKTKEEVVRISKTSGIFSPTRPDWSPADTGSRW